MSGSDDPGGFDQEPIGFYQELGVDPSADQDELRHAYRRRARALHPDVAAGADAGSAMRRLNEAWAVLGDPVQRRHYDQAQAAARPAAPAPAAPPPGPPPMAERFEAFPEPHSMGWFRLLRPSVLIPAVLFVIFVGTAYAGHTGTDTSTRTPVIPAQAPATVPGTTELSGPNLVGSCIQDEGNAVVVVPCSERPNSLVEALVPAATGCPIGTSGYLLSGQTEMVCAKPSGP